MARLTEAKRREIARRWIAGESARTLAAEFGIAISYISLIARRSGKRRPRDRTWIQKLERLRASGKLTEFVFKAPN